MAFHEIRFPLAIALGARGGPERRTEIVTLGSGHEERNTPWAMSRRRYNAGYGLKALSDIHALIGFFEARRGRLHGFRWRDRADWKSGAPATPVTALDQPLGTGDGSTAAFQLVKTYVSGEAGYTRAIAKPVTGTLRVAADGAALAEGADFTLNDTTGLVTFTSAPPEGAVLTAGFEFDVPVRFDTDFLDIDLAAFDAGRVPDIPIVEVRL
ncbi:MAG: TIGR02217 family protein [Alphaproteobacteria bacterium HGW-Alphaproteobacteria-12]|nr:MAG: TIGR02217 family protein [Alphaproteobacteria bacterium HGW-Alphaproteobacteria-12]